MSKTFIDTNILVYCLDKKDADKQMQCRTMVRQLEQTGHGVLSTQVLQEFFVVAVQKLGVDPIAAKGMLRQFENFEVIVVHPALIQSAIDYSILNQFSFWDALIIASAESAKCTTLWTEDMNSGQIVQGVQIMNPLQ